MFPSVTHSGVSRVLDLGLRGRVARDEVLVALWFPARQRKAKTGKKALLLSKRGLVEPPFGVSARPRGRKKKSRNESSGSLDWSRCVGELEGNDPGERRVSVMTFVEPPGVRTPDLWPRLKMKPRRVQVQPQPKQV